MILLNPARTLASPWADPGDTGLRHDLELLNDAGVINIPLTAWPVAWGDVHGALADADLDDSDDRVRDAYERVRQRLRYDLDPGTTHVRFGASLAENPRVIRTFEDTPRADAEALAEFDWTGERYMLRLRATYANDPFDGDEFRPDGTVIGMALGNWMLSAGWQDRWWGPGHDGSLILSTNARPVPGIGIQRIGSTPFETKWLRWMGPWTLSSFMGLLDDERVVNDAWLFGLRGSFRPVRGLEIGISRTAQWCGDDRPCGLDTFWDLLLGRDNQGVNVDPEDEPGNQLGGFDVRWALPRGIPAAVYLQWIGEDSRQGGPLIGAWLRQAGVEVHGNVLGMSHRSHIEVSDTMCREGGLGFGGDSVNCAYNHSIYQTGYRYQGRAIGHGMDGDGLSYAFGSTLLQSAGHVWNVSLRYMELNRVGAPDARHTLTATPQELMDVQLSHERTTRFGRFHVGVGYSRLDDEATGESSSEAHGFVRWSSQ